MVLKVNNLTKSFKNTKVLDSISFRVEESAAFGIFSKSGSGKTTLLSILMGLQKPDSGYFQWFKNDKNKPAGLKVGAFFNQANFYANLSVLDNLKIIAEVKQINSAKSEIEKVLNELLISDYALFEYQTLSLTIKSLVGIASALMGNPQVLVFDEPFAELDKEYSENILAIIQKKKAEGKTIIFASHKEEKIKSVCKEVIIIEKGKIVKQGMLEEVFHI